MVVLISPLPGVRIQGDSDVWVAGRVLVSFLGLVVTCVAVRCGALFGTLPIFRRAIQGVFSLTVVGLLLDKLVIVLFDLAEWEHHSVIKLFCHMRLTLDDQRHDHIRAVFLF